MDTPTHLSQVVMSQMFSFLLLLHRRGGCLSHTTSGRTRAVEPICATPGLEALLKF
jgi:hypothetical protein